MSCVAIAVRMVCERNPRLSADQAKARLCLRAQWRTIDGSTSTTWPADRVEAMLRAVSAGHALGKVAARLGTTQGEVQRRLNATCEAVLGTVYRRS